MGLLSRRKADPISAFERGLADLRSRREALQTKLRAAERAVEQVIADRRTRLLETDLDEHDGEPVRDIVTSARDQCDAIADAIETIDRQIVDVEGKLHAERDRQMREKEAGERRQQIAKAKEVLSEFVVKAEQLADALQSLSATNLSVGGLAAQVAVLAREINISGLAVLAEVEGYVSGVLTGRQPIKAQPAPAVVAPKKPTPVVERRLIYPHEHVRWTEPDGSTRVACQWGQASPPAPIAAKAIANNIADPFDSARAERLREMHGVHHAVPHVSQCTDLETGERSAPQGEGSAAEPAIYQGAPVIGTAFAR